MRAPLLSVALLLLVAPATAASSPPLRLPYIGYSSAMARPVPADPWRSRTSGCPSIGHWPNGADPEAVLDRGIACRERVVKSALEQGDLEREVIAETELALSPPGDPTDASRAWMERALENVELLHEPCWHSFLLVRSERLWPSLAPRRKILRKAVEVARSGSCTHELADALYTLAILHLGKEGEPLLEQALPLARSVDDAPLLVEILSTLARSYSDRGDRRALSLREEIVALHGARGEEKWEMTATWNLGLTYEQLGDSATALPLLERYVEYLKAQGRDPGRFAAFLEEVRKDTAS